MPDLTTIPERDFLLRVHNYLPPGHFMTLEVEKRIDALSDQPSNWGNNVSTRAGGLDYKPRTTQYLDHEGDEE